MRVKALLLALVMTALLAVAPSGSAAAFPVRAIPVSGAIVGYDSVEGGQPKIVGVPDWATSYESYTVILRGVEAHAFWQGSEYLQGTEWSTVSVKAHVFCGQTSCEVSGGSVQGTDRLTLDSIAGGWDGRVEGRVTAFSHDLGFSYEGTYVAAGWGELEGWQLRATFDNYTPAGFMEMTGYAVPPAAS